MELFVTAVSDMCKYAVSASFGVKLSVSVGLAFALYYKTKVCKVRFYQGVIGFTQDQSFKQ